MVAAVTLIQLSVFQFTGTVMSTLRTDVPLWPTPCVQSGSAQLLGPVLLQKRCQTQAGLKLDHVLAHGFPRLPLIIAVSVSSYIWRSIDDNQ
jgi:hypothetical protein